MNVNDNTEVTYYKDPKYSSGPNKNNDRNSGANPFYLCLPGASHLIYENNTGVGQKYVTISKDTLPSNVAKTASDIATKVAEKKTREFMSNDYVNMMVQKYEDERKEKHEIFMYFHRGSFAPTKPSLLQGYQGKYYMINGEKYDQHFPYEWATNHLSHPSLHIGSGPLNCENCKKYGSILTVFVGYCMDCHRNIYKGSRPGIKDAVKTTITDFRKLLPYMKDVRFIDIGDRKDWTLLKEREERRLEEVQKERKYREFEYSQLQTRNDLLIRTRRNENVSEEEWDDYWGSTPLTNEDLLKWATSEYL
jgi:hypothetical protein